MTFRLLAICFVVFQAGQSIKFLNLKVETYLVSNNTKQSFCDDHVRDFTTVDASFLDCSYAEYTCFNVGLRSELSLWCTIETADLEAELTAAPKEVDSTDATMKFVFSVASDQGQITCEGSLMWDSDVGYCGCVLYDYSSLNVEYDGMAVGDYIRPTEDIDLKCTGDRYFADYAQTKSVSCEPDSDLTNLNCQTEAELKLFDNKVAHFEGTSESYVIMVNPFSEDLTELALCFWLRTKDAVGSIFSMVNEDHWNALRFDTHTSHIHFTLAGLHTDHGLVPPIALKDEDWRYFCANWRSVDGNATIYVRKHKEAKTEMYSEILALSVGLTVRATGGKLALGNLWKEDITDTEFNPVGAFEGDVMGLTLFRRNVDRETFNQMFEDCSTVLDQEHVVLSWKDLLSSNNEVSVSATFGQQVCSKGYTYGSSALNFPISNDTIKLSNYISNYAKIENAFSVDLTEMTICAIIKSDIKIGTIFSYVISSPEFQEEIVLEKHKTHMHFYMAGIDQQVGAVPKITIDMERWYSTCFTWSNTGRWRGYLDGVEMTNNQTSLLQYTIGKRITGGGTCYLGILKKFVSFRQYRGYGGGVTELNLWGKALTAEQIHKMVTTNDIYAEHLLVSWGTLLAHTRGSVAKEDVEVCQPPVEEGPYRISKMSGKIQATLFLMDETVEYSCAGATVVSKETLPYTTKTCTSQGLWEPADKVLCQTCEAASLFECPEEMCLEESKICDGTKDCAGGDDELNCQNKNVYWIVIGVLLAIIILLIPAIFFAKKARRARVEMMRVKRLTDSWEVKREYLQMEEKLGEGAFGKVFKGYLLEKPKYETTLTVAVKELSDIATERDQNMFLEEIRLSKKLGNHPNIVGIIGSIIVYEPYCLILEFVDGGDLLDYVQKNKNETENRLSQEDQVFFAWQIANGMEYVSAKNFVHRDLAARNVLISTSKQCKVTDFGLARDLYNYDEYQSEGGRLPIKWMSPEAIFELKFTTESDVWSYGIMLYELFSWGGSPYPGIDASLLRDRLVNGFRMSAPDNTPDFMYSIMLQCWEFKSEARPTFKDVRTFIEQNIGAYQPYIDFKDNVLADYNAQVGAAETMCAASSTCTAPDNHDDSVPLVRTESSQYKNVTFSNEPEPAVTYTAEPAQQSTDVNIGIVDGDGLAEITRSDYMNT